MVSFTLQGITNSVSFDLKCASGSGMTMTEIAEACGFATIRSFNRTFRELTGTAPTRLPEDYTFGERYSAPSDSAFDPTLYDCVLIESCDG